MRRVLLLSLTLVKYFIVHSQIITTVAGGATGHGGYWGEGGLATSAQLSSGAAVAVDFDNNLYIGDKERVLKVDATTGIIHTVAGTGILGYNGDSIPAITAQLNWASKIAIDSIGNLYVGDGNNNRIRKVDKASGIITTYAGNGTWGCDGDGGDPTLAKISPGCINWDKFGNFYLGEQYKIRKIDHANAISTVAGLGTPGVTNDNISALTTHISDPHGISMDSDGNIYFNDTTGAIRKIAISTGMITRIAGTGDNVRSPYSGDGINAMNCHISPLDVYADTMGNVYIADGNNNRVEKVDVNGIIHTVAGNGMAGFSGDGGAALSAKLNYPQSIAFDKCGNMYIADYFNKRIRKVTFNPNCFPEHVKEANKLKDIIIHPNPAQQQLTISSSNAVKQISIFNTIGQVLITQRNYSDKAIIDVCNLSPGLYFIKVSDRNGADAVQRFVKE